MKATTGQMSPKKASAPPKVSANRSLSVDNQHRNPCRLYPSKVLIVMRSKNKPDLDRDRTGHPCNELVALTATEFPACPSVSTRFTACHIGWFPAWFPRCHGVEGSAGPKQSLEVQKLTSNPRNSPSFPGPLSVQPRNGATKLP